MDRPSRSAQRASCLRLPWPRRLLLLAGGLTVRVDAGSGAPRLVVNGRPVRPRMFFGGPGSGPVRIKPAGRTIQFESTAETEAQHTVTLHFRFGHAPDDVFLDNIRIEDVTSGKDVTPVSDFENGPDAFTRA